MKKLIVFLNTGYCGEDSVDAIGFDDDATEDEIISCCWDMAIEHAQAYGREVGGDELEENEDIDYVYPDFHYEEYDAKKHDMYCVGEGSFEDYF